MTTTPKLAFLREMAHVGRQLTALPDAASSSTRVYGPVVQGKESYQW
ncbi:hypothetical protein [Rhodococcus sp. 05-2254-6]|nr:hypothetical protein [Rhodococcus sp. 05-2254-6]